MYIKSDKLQSLKLLDFIILISDWNSLKANKIITCTDMRSPFIILTRFWHQIGNTCTHYMYTNNVSTALIVLFYALIVCNHLLIQVQ